MLSICLQYEGSYNTYVFINDLACFYKVFVLLILQSNKICRQPALRQILIPIKQTFKPILYDLNDNVHSMTWRRLQMLPIKMFIENLNQFWCVKGLIVTRRNLVLLGKIRPGWALFLESLGFAWLSLKVVVLFSLQLIHF